MSELPLGWAWTTLGGIAKTIRGVTYRKAEAESEPGGGRVPLLRATNIVEGRLELDTELVYVPSSRVSDAQLLSVGDIVIAASSGSRAVVGKSAPLRRDWLGTFGAFCSVARPTEAVDASYVGYFVGSEKVRRRWSGLSAGTNINNLKREHFTETPVPLPPLNEQRRIVAAIEEQLSRLDAADASLVAASRRLEGLRQSSLAGAVNGVSPLVPLAELLVSLRNGLFVSRPAAQPPGVPIFRISAVRPLTLDVEDIRYAAVDEVASNDFLVRGGDLLFTRYSGNPEYVGACARVPEGTRPTLHPDKLIRAVVDREKADPAYLEIACSTGVTRDEIRARRKTTAGQVGIAGGQLKTVPVPVPPLEDQRRIVAEVEERLSVIDAMRTSIERAERRSATLRRSILERAFRGELVPQNPSDEPASVLLDRIRAAAR